jgi:hypothetical protein
MHILPAAVEGVRFLVVDMTPVTRSDSSGAHFIYDLAKDLKAQGIQLVLCNPTDTVSVRVHNCTWPCLSSCILRCCVDIYWSRASHWQVPCSVCTQMLYGLPFAVLHCTCTAFIS